MKKTTELAEVAKAMAKIDFCMMQTFKEEGIDCRPMSNNSEVEYDGDSWFFSYSDTDKIAELEQDSRVHLTYTDPTGPSFISVWGTGKIVVDVELKKKLWQKQLEKWFGGKGPEDPEVTLIKVSANRIRTWGQIGEQEFK
ncbi:pyridoxamine 5'-phosphate oxidase family protein [Limnobacter parvus]|uniref:Pyridoxamine 5'-phosphate oxidase family protein n=1 Tax=Limnobacter parvus TaxID=2939690 RepID=A0ABT1XIL6_9BURK|nr:pyridoxamine 5'-phosphate oxidase family protein [Limnobacter parvus]MCR2746132.1 pyridoxamine 5'-phosphate oxidase family protein [Limnobacter parvus]